MRPFCKKSHPRKGRATQFVATASLLAIAFTGAVRSGGSQTPAAPTPAESAPAQPATPPAAQGGTISGSVKSGAVPLPGVAVTATNTLTGKHHATTTDITA